MVKPASDAPESKHEKSRHRERGVRPGDAVRASMQLMTSIVGGAAGAVADGCQAFDEELSAENVRERGLFNGFVEGMIAGQTRFLRSLAESGDRFQESLRDFEDNPRTAEPRPNP